MRVLFIFLTLVSSAFGEHIYMAQSALGNGDGTSAANAKAAYTFFNTAANWDTLVNTTNGKIGPGDTVHIVGILTPAAGSIGNSSNQLLWQGSGTPGNPITLKFDVGGRIRHPTGTTTGLIYSPGGLHDVIIEGANGTVAVTTGSFVQIDIEIYANGTNLANQVEGTSAVIITGAGSNITIKNLYMFGAYQRAKNHTSDLIGDGNLASVRGQNNLIYDNCRADFGEGGIGLSSQGNTTGFRMTNNYIYGCSTAIKIGTALGFVNDGMVITGNVLDGFAYWAGIPAPNQHHCDGIQTITPGGGSSQGNAEHRNYIIAYNRIGPDLGLYGSMNAHIFLEDNVSGVRVYNNLLTANSTPTNPLQNNAAPGTANGFIEFGQNTNYFALTTGVRSLIVNNTIIGGGSGKGITSSFARVEGNIVTNLPNIAGIWNQQPDSPTHGKYAIIDKNVYYNSNGQYSFGVTGSPGGGIYGSIGSWRNPPSGIPGWDINSITQDPQVNFTTGALASTSPAIGFAPTQSVFTDDLNRVTRSVPWDAGAAEFTAGGPPPPTVVSSAISAAGTQFSLVLSEAIQFGAGGNAGMTVSSAGGTVTLGTPSIAGSTITWPITNRLIGQGESLTRAYTQPNNGIEATDDGQDLASFAATAITNSSTVAQAALPQFAPLPGAYSSTQNVAITSTTSTATIRYTTDGTDPTASTGTLYTTPISTSLSTTYKARAFATGFLDSPVATGAYQIGDFIINTIWSNVAVTSQTGTFTWSFRATPSASGIDGVIGLADHNAAGYTDLAVIPRFNTAGRIEAINTGDYAAVNIFNYVGGQAYDFVVTVNVPAHTYSMTVVQAGGSTPTTIATNYGFRSQQATVNHLDVFSGVTTGGTVTVSNMVFTGAAPTLSLTGIATNPAGTQITATFNSQPSFGLGGQGGFTVSASGGATTPSSPTIGTNAITWNLSRTIGRGETISATYVQPGNGIEAASGGADLASFAGQSAVNNSTVDLTAPTPNPSTFGIAPSALTSSTITMTATTSTDANSPPVQYFFNEVSGNAGGSDSGWQSSLTFTDAGLAAGTQYRYRVQVRDSAVPPNVTTFSQEFSATTKSVAGAHPAMPFNMARANIVTP